jgi:hypothetical protein
MSSKATSIQEMSACVLPPLRRYKYLSLLSFLTLSTHTPFFPNTNTKTREGWLMCPSPDATQKED